MIAEFVATWSLFGESYLAGWLIAVVLAVAGVWVVARDQIFLGAAVSQASTLGTATALWIEGAAAVAGHTPLAEAFTFGLAVAASIATALASAFGERRSGESAEAITGWVFLAGGSIPVLMLAHHPHGLEQVHRLMLSSLLGASRADVVLFGALALATGLGVLRFGRSLALYAIDPEMAAAVGMGVRRWRWGTAVWLGLAVGLSLHAAGLIYSFGCLVLPALTARQLCREIAPLFWVAPAVALAATVPAFVLANAWDVPPAQLAVAFLCIALAAAWVARASGLTARRT